MVSTLATLLTTLVLMQAQGDVVNDASFLRWDDGNVGLPTETRVYLERAPGVVPDGLPDAMVGTGLTQWAISAASGQWHGAVTTFDPVSLMESGPSNEVDFWVLGKPENLRIVLWIDSEDRLRVKVFPRPA